MVIVILGAPGAGKGTMSKLISKRYEIPHISTGDIIRKIISEESNSKHALIKTYIDKGELVPDDIVIDILESRLKEEDCKKGFLLDGFPRNVSQADYLDKILRNLNRTLNVALNLELDKKIILERLTNRRVCPQCGKAYNLKLVKPIKEGFCDDCDKELIQRDDDKEDVILNRLRVYDEMSSPLIEYYKNKNLLYNVDGSLEKDKLAEMVFRGCEK